MYTKRKVLPTELKQVLSDEYNVLCDIVSEKVCSTGGLLWKS